MELEPIRNSVPASVSLVVPVYHSETSLRPLVERLTAVLQKRPAEFEIILVNDGSPDRSWSLIECLARGDPRVRGISLMRNFGQHNAVLCGIRAARHDVIVTMDADLQHPPEEITSLLAKLEEGYDVAYGVPAEVKHSLFRRLASQMMRFIFQRTLGIANASQISAFRAFRTQLRNAFAEFQGPFVSVDVLLTWGTMRFTSVLVRHDTRVHGRSSYSLTKLLAYCFDVITGFSTLPLRLASWIGFFFTIFGIGVLVYVVGRYLIHGYSVSGFPFLASIIAIFSGAQLFALGIIGEYISRMHFRLMDRPTYAVRQTTEHGVKEVEKR
ncbi:MAG: glycosyltransferase family 2 protein [Kiritimatiellae bacterium]|nr:glycosyltransferase family 2 protein [Kiritimatiellia bacterium]